MDNDDSLHIKESENTPKKIDNTEAELHPFVKLAIAYLSIIAGLAAVGLYLYIVSSYARGLQTVQTGPFVITIIFYSSLLSLSIVSVYGIVNRKKYGEITAFIALGLSILSPAYDQKSVLMSFQIIFWFTIPNAVVGLLLLLKQKLKSDKRTGNTYY